MKSGPADVLNGSPKKPRGSPVRRIDNNSEVKCVAIDCEMVGVGPMKESALARVSLVDERGTCLLDKFTKPLAPVTDYRTDVSGIREENLRDAQDFKSVVAEVAALLKGRIVVGHAVHHDFKAMLFQHPHHMIRDTSVFFKKLNNYRTPSLKKLASDYLDISIQSGEHSSVEDARATMKLYLLYQTEWEESLKVKRAETVQRNRTQTIPAKTKTSESV